MLVSLLISLSIHFHRLFLLHLTMLNLDDHSPAFEYILGLTSKTRGKFEYYCPETLPRRGAGRPSLTPGILVLTAEQRPV